MVAWSKVWVWGCTLAWTVSSNPAGAWMFVCCECCWLWSWDLFIGPITRPEDTNWVWCVWVLSWRLDIVEALVQWGLLHQGGGVKIINTHTGFPTETHPSLALVSSCNSVMQRYNISFQICFLSFLYLMFFPCTKWAGEPSLCSDWLWVGRSGDRIPVGGGARITAPVQTGPGSRPVSCKMGTGAKSGRGVTMTPHPLLVPWSRKSRAIPLLPL